jgi:N-acetylmuramoyl-L-alanine amidase
MTRIALVVGHNQIQQGAVRVTPDKATEYVWCGRLCDMASNLSPDIRVFRREFKQAGVSAELRACYAEVDAWGADVSAEIHFNAFASPAATGTETLYATGAGKIVAQRVQSAVVAALGLPDRGAKPVGASARGYTSLISGKAPAVLLELYFGSNSDDCRRADLRRGEVATALVRALGGPLVPDVPSPPPDSLEARIAALEARMDAAGI